MTDSSDTPTTSAAAAAGAAQAQPAQSPRSPIPAEDSDRPIEVDDLQVCAQFSYVLYREGIVLTNTAW